MSKCSKTLLILNLLLLSTTPLAAYPMGNVVTLPVPIKKIELQDLDILKTILDVPLYPDSQDKNLFHYAPPFRVLPYKEGATSIIPNTIKAENVYKADTALNRMQSEEEQPPEHVMNDPGINSKREWINFQEKNLAELKLNLSNEIKEISSEIKRMRSKLEEATANENKKLIDYYEKAISERKAELATLKEEGDSKVKDETLKLENMRIDLDKSIAKAVEEWRRRKLYPILTNLASAGSPIDTKLYPKNEDLIAAMNKALDELKRSNGGFLSMNIYSGFTDQQLKEIRLLKKKYWPELKLSLMMANDLQFTSLAQLENSRRGVRENTMFKEVRGSGGYHGATVNFDLTVDGATSLSTALGPFVLPVGINAVIREEVPAFRGNLNCDYTNGFNTQGRADVIDGWIFWDNDIRNSIRTTSNARGNCSIQVYEGDPQGAEYVALKEIENNLENHLIRQTKLSQREARHMQNSVLNQLGLRQIEANVENDNSWIKDISDMGRTELAFRVIGSNSYWHTSKYNTGITESLNFNKSISHKGFGAVRKDMNATLCLFFNAEKRAYDRCTSAQEEKAENFMVATKDASTSTECKDAKTLNECMKNRLANAPELKPQKEEKAVDNYLEI